MTADDIRQGTCYLRQLIVDIHFLVNYHCFFRLSSNDDSTKEFSQNKRMADKAKDVVKTGATRAITAFFEYDTPKIVHIKSKTVGVINRIIQLGILAYIVG